VRSGVLRNPRSFDRFTLLFPVPELTVTGSVATPRARHTATLLQDGRVLVTGGTDANGGALASAEIYQ
jgi:hypothetical protein